MQGSGTESDPFPWSHHLMHHQVGNCSHSDTLTIKPIPKLWQTDPLFYVNMLALWSQCIYPGLDHLVMSKLHISASRHWKSSYLLKLVLHSYDSMSRPSLPRTRRSRADLETKSTLDLRPCFCLLAGVLKVGTRTSTVDNYLYSRCTPILLMYCRNVSPISTLI